MKKIFLLVVVTMVLISLTGCGTMGTFKAHNITNVELSGPNFKIVAQDVQGYAMQGYLLGFSAPQGPDINTFALVKINGVDKPFASAVTDLWNNFREQYGDTKGKKLALVNIRQDTETLNTIVYTEAHYYITADVVEFIETDD